MAPLVAGATALIAAAGSAIGVVSASGLFGKLLLTGLAIGVQALLAPGKPKQPTPEDLKNTKPSEEGPGRFAFGRMETEGVIAFGNTADFLIYRVVMHAFGPLEAVEEYFYDGRSIVVDQPGGLVQSPPFGVADENGSYLKIQTKAGTGNDTAWDQLIVDFPDLWTEDHRLRGICQSLIQITNPGTTDPKFGQILNGGIKALRIRGRFGKFFDPRDSSTEWSTNSALICMHYLRQLPTVVTGEINFDDIEDTADACDVEFDKGVGPDLSPLGTAPDVITVSGGTASYNNATQTFNFTGTSSNNTRPFYRWNFVLDNEPKYQLRMVLTGDYDRLAVIRIGAANILIADAVTTETTWEGEPALSVIAAGDPGGSNFLRFDFDGTGGSFSVRVEFARLKLAVVTPTSQISGGGEGVITTDVVESMLRCAGLEHRWTAENKRTLRLLEDYPDAELHLTAKHIIDVSVKKGPEGAKRPNFCRVKYLCPERNYSVAELDMDGVPWARVEDEIGLYGEQEMTVTLEFCPDPSQAQRIARRLFYLQRADTGVLTTSFAGLAAWGLRCLDIDIPDMGEDGAPLTVRALIEPVSVNDEAGTCEIPFVIIPDNLKIPYNPGVEAIAPPAIPDLQFESDLETPAMPSSAVAVNDGSWSVVLTYSADPLATSYEANYRTYTAGLPNVWAQMDTADGTTATLAGDYRGERMDFRVRVFNEDGESSYFSPILEIASLST